MDPSIEGAESTLPCLPLTLPSLPFIVWPLDPPPKFNGRVVVVVDVETFVCDREFKSASVIS